MIKLFNLKIATSTLAFQILPVTGELGDEGNKMLHPPTPSSQAQDVNINC